MRACFAQARAPRRDWEPPRPRHRDFISITKTHRSQLPGPSCRRRARRRRRAFACSPCRTPLADASEDPRRSRHLQPWCAASWPISLNLLLILSLDQMTWKREEEYEEGNGEQALFRCAAFFMFEAKRRSGRHQYNLPVPVQYDYWYRSWSPMNTRRKTTPIKNLSTTRGCLWQRPCSYY